MAETTGEASTNKFLVVVVTIILGLCLHLLIQIVSPKKKDPVDEKAFDEILDDAGWAEEEEEKPASNPPVTLPTPTTTAGATSRSIPMPGTGEGGAAPAKKDDPSAAKILASVMKLKKQADDGSVFKIGDRVVLKNLISAKELNGRHGVIADVCDKKTERYPIDLDLVDQKRNKPLSVKPCNLEKESTDNTLNKESADESNEMERAASINGCLPEAHARACSFIFTSMRGTISNTLNGEKDPHKLATFGWKFWTAPNNPKEGVYPSLLNFLTKGILLKQKLADLDKQVNPTTPKGAYSLVTRAMKSKYAVGSWNVRVEGTFWIVGMGPTGTLVVPCHNTRQVYLVQGYKVPLGAQGKFPRPPKFYLTMVPWFGQLVHDPMIMSTTGTNQVELASPKLAQELVDNCKIAQMEGRVITSLKQLEVENGSTEGLPFVPFQATPPPAGAPTIGGQLQAGQKMKLPEMKPATESERCLVENLNDFTQIIAPNDPMGVWNSIRQGTTEEENPKHTSVIINGKGGKLLEYTTATLMPTGEEVLKAVLALGAKMGGRRPSIIGVDDILIFQRLSFICQGTKQLRIVLLNVTRKKGPNLQQQQEQEQQKAKDEEASSAAANSTTTSTSAETPAMADESTPASSE